MSLSDIRPQFSVSHFGLIILFWYNYAYEEVNLESTNSSFLIDVGEVREAQADALSHAHQP
jgi:hypothetical protein